MMARHRRAILAASISLLLLASISHALADSRDASGTIRTYDIRLDRRLDERHDFTLTTTVLAPLGAKLWPRLAYEAAPQGRVSDGAKAPTVAVDILVNGEFVETQSMDGDVAHHSGLMGMFPCKPRGACAGPKLAVGYREVTIEMKAHVTHTPQGHTGVYRISLGPATLDVDRGPWAP